MSEGPNAEKPEIKQEESSSSIWSEIARDVALSTILGPVGYGVSRALAGSDDAQSKALVKTTEEVSKLVLETALPIVTIGIGGAVVRGAVKGAECALKASDKANGTAEESSVDKAFNFFKAMHGETLPFFILGPLALVPQAREPITKADGLVLDKIRSVSETMFESAKKEPWRFAAMSMASPLIPVLDAIINNEK